MVKLRKPRTDGIRAAFEQLALAQATLVANQAALVAQVAEARKKSGELRREATERFQHIESLLLSLVEVLPEALRERIGLRKK